MGKITGFMDYKRKDCKREDSLSRLKHWNEFDTPLKEEERKEQAAESTMLLSPRTDLSNAATTGTGLSGVQQGNPPQSTIRTGVKCPHPSDGSDAHCQ